MASKGRRCWTTRGTHGKDYNEAVSRKTMVKKGRQGKEDDKLTECSS